MGGKDYDYRQDNREGEAAELRGILAERTAQEWEDYLQSSHVPVGRVRTLPTPAFFYGLEPGQEIAVRARAEDGKETVFAAIVRIDSPVEVEYYCNGGILQTVLRSMLRTETP